MPRPRKKTTEDTPPAESSSEPVLTHRSRSRRMSTPAFIASVVLSICIVFGGAILIGRSDRGQIDVTAAIQNANQTSRDAFGDQAVIVNTNADALRNMPNGGLVAQENQDANQPPTETQATTTSTTTDAGTATTTETTSATDGAEEAPSSAETQVANETQTDGQ